MWTQSILGRWGASSGWCTTSILYGKQHKANPTEPIDWTQRLNPNFPKLEGIQQPASSQTINIAPATNFWQALPPSEPLRVHADNTHNVTPPWCTSCPRKLLWAWILTGWLSVYLFVSFLTLASSAPNFGASKVMFLQRAFWKWWWM